MGIEGDKKGRLARTVPVVRQTSKEACLQEANPTKKTAVSYTHLTLPTICSV